MYLTREFSLKVIHVFISLLLAMIVVLGVLHQQDTNNQRQRERDVHAAQVTAFILAEQIYGNQRQIYTGCITNHETRDAVRTVLFKIVDLSDLFPSGQAPAGVAQYTGTRDNYIDLFYPPLSKESCGPEPKEPVPPKGLVP
jgi:hypothetical protein